MTTKKVLAMFCAMALIILGVFGILSSGPKATATSPPIPDTPDSTQIQHVLQRAWTLESEAAHTFDTSEFASVFVNDPRGGELGTSTIDFVRHVWEETGHPLADNRDYVPGYLDYKQAYFAWWERGALQFEALQAQAEREGRALTPEEARSLVDASRRAAMPRAQGPIDPPNLEFKSIRIDDTTAVAVVSDGPRTWELTLVKVNDQWLIAGGKIVSIHP